MHGNSMTRSSIAIATQQTKPNQTPTEPADPDEFSDLPPLIESDPDPDTAVQPQVYVNYWANLQDNAPIVILTSTLTLGSR